MVAGMVQAVRCMVQRSEQNRLESSRSGYYLLRFGFLLYTLMGIAAGFIWQRRVISPSPLALSLYVIQLILNIIWPLIFFCMRNPGLAFGGDCPLWISIVATIFIFWRIYSYWFYDSLFIMGEFRCQQFTIWRMNISAA